VRRPRSCSAAIAARWLKFNAVGAIGIGVQLAALFLLENALHVDYLLATALAVEAAILHNFLWHERFTWADRRSRNRIARLARFNLTTGMFSLLGNLAAMKLLVGALGLPYLPANAAAVAACSLLNFLVSDRVVFEAELAGGRQAEGQSMCPCICRSTDQTSAGFFSKG
jgi:putative flippase GtrA